MDAWLKANRVALGLALACLALAGVVVFVGGRASERPLIVVSQSPKASPGGQRAFISGEVARPGVYVFESGDRVEQLVALAGGFTPEADLTAVNLALRLRDEQQVHVPKRMVSGASGTAESGVALVDLNSASAAELDTLPGVGPATAQSILEHRTRVGPFNQVDDLLTLKLVSSATFERIRALVTVR